MGAIGLVVSGVKSCIFLSDKVFIYILYNNKHFEKPAKSSISLPCALLKSKECTCQCRQTQPCCWSPRVCFTYVSAVQLGPCSLVKVCQRWHSLSLVVVYPSSPPAQWCACPLRLVCCRWFAPGYCDTGVWLAVTMKAWSEESGVLGGHRGCFSH